MPFSPLEKSEYYRKNPRLRRAAQAKWRACNPEQRNAAMARWRANKKRRDEIEGAKQSLLSAHRLRQIGVFPRMGFYPRRERE